MSAQPQDDYAAEATDGVVHQALRREVNERISSISKSFWVTPSNLIDVVCECVREDCAARITMSAQEYETVRRFPTRFFVKEGHEVAAEERVVAEADGYVVIEAYGREGIYAIRVDPRRRGPRRLQDRG